MGNKISWEDSQKCGISSQNDKIILDKPNKYGYQVNINHPKVQPLYERFKRSKKAIILSDKERLEFEEIIMKKVRKVEKG